MLKTVRRHGVRQTVKPLRDEKKNLKAMTDLRNREVKGLPFAARPSAQTQEIETATEPKVTGLSTVTVER